MKIAHKALGLKSGWTNLKEPIHQQTKDEKFLIAIARQAQSQGNLLSWVRWQTVADELRLGHKSCHNIVNILAKTYLVQKRGDDVRLTHVSLRHYGAQISEFLGVELPNFDSLES